jgi:uncharacterized caspase-like protein
MVGRRVALLVATDRYQDTGLSRLAAPASDAEQLAAVLRDTRIGGFEVTTLYNEPHYVVARAIGKFYRDRRGDDLTLLYITGHGVKDDDGRLYLAMTDTDRENLPFTGVPSEQIRAAMEGSRSRQKVLILDCCYAGAFPAGLGVKGDPSVHALEQLGGSGCVVLTSSDAMQLSFEGNQVTQTGPASLRPEPSSLFTRYLIKGLRTGKADLDGDGDITLDELYSYVHDRVIDEQPLQRPKIKEDIEGGIRFAQNVNWTVPARIIDAVDSPYPPVKLGALGELRGLYYRGNVIVKQRVLDTVRLLAEDDSKNVSGAASQFLSELIQQEEPRQAKEAAQAREAEDQAYARQVLENWDQTLARPALDEAQVRQALEAEDLARRAEEADRGHQFPASVRVPPDTYDDLVRSAFAELVKPGRLLFNPPDRMKLGQTERVEVRLARTLELDAELRENLRGHGEPQLEEIPTAPLMAVTLDGDGFRIKAYSDEEQAVTQDGITTWEFDIRATERGQQRLVMCVSLRIPVPGQPLERKSIPVREATIDVQVGVPALVGHFVSSYWQWFIGTAIAIAAVVVAVLVH